MRNRLETQDAPTAKFSQPRQRVLEPVDGSERIELVDHEPQAPWVTGIDHGLEDREAHPGGKYRAQRRDLRRGVRHEQYAAPTGHPVAYGEAARALRAHVLERCGGRGHHRADRAEHARILGVEKRLGGRTGHQRPQLRVRGRGQQPPQLAGIAPAALAAAARDGRDEGTGVTTPFARGGVLGGGNEPAGELLDIPRRANLREGIPLDGQRLERVQHHVTAAALVEARTIAAIRVGDDDTVATRQRPGHQTRDRRRFARPGRPDQLEMPRLLGRCDGHAGEQQGAAVPQTPAPYAAPRGAPLEYARTATVAVGPPRNQQHHDGEQQRRAGKEHRLRQLSDDCLPRRAHAQYPCTTR